LRETRVKTLDLASRNVLDMIHCRIEYCVCILLQNPKSAVRNARTPHPDFNNQGGIAGIAEGM
jgi:hypothetical protein